MAENPFENATLLQSSLGQPLLSDPQIHQHVDGLVAAVGQRSAHIKAAQPAQAAAKVPYEALLERIGELRGRAMLYPFLSSGLGNGALVELMDGSIKWDLITGIGVNFFGHSDPGMLRESLIGALSDTVKHGNLLTGKEPYAFSDTLVRMAAKGSDLKHCFLSTSGAMANENALKVCLQKHAPACRVLAFSHCFMGRSIVMSQIGDSAANRIGIPLNVHVDYMPFWDAEAAARMGKTRFIDMALWHLDQYVQRYPGQHACFIFELVQGEGGFNVGDKDYLEALMQYCKAHQIAVWDDEIQSFGRTTEMFAYDVFGLGKYVDVFCVGKMTQACATLFTEAYNPKPGLLSGTFTGETVSFRTGQALLERLESGGYYGPDGLFAQHFTRFQQQVEALAQRHPDWFPGELPHSGGIGGMMRMTPFGGHKEQIVSACKALYDEGVIAFWCGHGPYHIRLLPPLPVLPLDDWTPIFEHIERAFAKVTP